MYESPASPTRVSERSRTLERRESFEIDQPRVSYVRLPETECHHVYRFFQMFQPRVRDSSVEELQAVETGHGFQMRKSKVADSSPREIERLERYHPLQVSEPFIADHRPVQVEPLQPPQSPEMERSQVSPIRLPSKLSLRSPARDFRCDNPTSDTSLFLKVLCSSIAVETSDRRLSAYRSPLPQKDEPKRHGRSNRHRGDRPTIWVPRGPENFPAATFGPHASSTSDGLVRDQPDRLWSRSTNPNRSRHRRGPV